MNQREEYLRQLGRARLGVGFGVITRDQATMYVSLARALRIINGWALWEVGARAGLHPATVASAETWVTDPRLSTLHAMAEALGVPKSQALSLLDAVELNIKRPKIGLWAKRAGRRDLIEDAQYLRVVA